MQKPSSESSDVYQRVKLESWFTNLEQAALNHCQVLPTPYKQLLNRKQKHIVYYSSYNPSKRIAYLRTSLYSQSHHMFTTGYSVYRPIKSLTRVFEFSTDQDYQLTLKMASTWVVETSVTNDGPSKDSNHPDDLFQSKNVL